MLEEHLVQTCELIDLGRNEYGDYVLNSTTELSCRFRYIDTIRRTTHQELNDSDAMLWVSSDSGVENGSIVRFEGVFYQVERIWNARRLGETEVQFTKCDLKVTDVNIS